MINYIFSLCHGFSHSLALHGKSIYGVCLIWFNLWFDDTRWNYKMGEMLLFRQLIFLIALCFAILQLIIIKEGLECVLKVHMLLLVEIINFVFNIMFTYSFCNGHNSLLWFDHTL
jgi:hypothetical protein